MPSSGAGVNWSGSGRDFRHGLPQSWAKVREEGVDRTIDVRSKRTPRIFSTNQGLKSAVDAKRRRSDMLAKQELTAAERRDMTESRYDHSVFCGGPA